jgi:hypothetical protein
VPEHFVYVYRTTPKGPVRYVGYEHHVGRALSHAEGSHNPGLRDWLLHRDAFDLTIAGPYRDEVEAKAVEAALISAMDPKFNKAPGDGPKFVPVGVPGELSGRSIHPPWASPIPGPPDAPPFNSGKITGGQNRKEYRGWSGLTPRVDARYG